MRQHATIEELSAYLDGELDPAAAEEIAELVRKRPEYGERLESLRRVVTTLQRLERESPPSTLGSDVQRRVALAGKPRGVVEEFEARLREWPKSSQLFFTFALVFSLAVVMYLFAAGVERARRGGTALVIGEVPVVEDPTGQVEESRQVAGREFERVDGVWREAGITGTVAPIWLDAEEPEAREILAVYPDLVSLGDRVLLRIGDGVVGIRGILRLEALSPEPPSATPDASEPSAEDAPGSR